MDSIPLSHNPTRNHLFFGLNHETFVAGKLVDGVVVFVVQKPTRISRIGITWKGKEVVVWSAGVALTQEEYRGEHVVFQTTTKLAGERVYEAGTYTFSFACPLPVDAPANYEEEETHNYISLTTELISRRRKVSYIRYGATAFVDFLEDITLGDDDRDSEEDFDNVTRAILPGRRAGTISRQIGFRVAEYFNPECMRYKPISSEGVSSFLMGGGKLDAKLSVANGGVLFSGQKMYINLDIENGSSRIVDSIYLTLFEFVTFHGANKGGKTAEFPRRRKLISADVEDSEIDPRGTFKKDLMIQIPRVVQPSITVGKYISRTFELSCEICVSLGTNLVLRVPITILEWSPLIKDDLPDKMPVRTRLDDSDCVTDSDSDCLSETDSYHHRNRNNHRDIDIRMDRAANDNDDNDSETHLSFPNNTAPLSRFTSSKISKKIKNTRKRKNSGSDSSESSSISFSQSLSRRSSLSKEDQITTVNVVSEHIEAGNSSHNSKELVGNNKLSAAASEMLEEHLNRSESSSLSSSSDVELED